MDGLLLKLNNYQGNYPEPRFWNLFGSIRRNLDRFYWCFTLQPWMAPPINFYDDTSVLLSYGGEGASEVQLWRPGGLSSYADQFSEEYIELWGIDPATGNPQQITAMYLRRLLRDSRNAAEIVRKYARVWLIYTDSTCWEIYTPKTSLLDCLRKSLLNEPWVAVYDSHCDQREKAFAAADLSDVWSALYGRISQRMKNSRDAE